MTSRLEFQTIEVQKGNKESYIVTVLNGGGAVNLVGYTIKMQIRQKNDDTVVIADSTVDSGMAIADGSAGSVYASGLVGCTITAAVSLKLPDLAYGEVQAVSGGGLAPVTLAKFLLVAYPSIFR